MEIKNLVDKVISRKNKRITDEVFCSFKATGDLCGNTLNWFMKKGLRL
jgi:hypothetical protein